VVAYKLRGKGNTCCSQQEPVLKLELHNQFVKETVGNAYFSQGFFSQERYP